MTDCVRACTPYVCTCTYNTCTYTHVEVLYIHMYGVQVTSYKLQVCINTYTREILFFGPVRHYSGTFFVMYHINLLLLYIRIVKMYCTYVCTCTIHTYFANERARMLHMYNSMYNIHNLCQDGNTSFDSVESAVAEQKTYTPATSFSFFFFFFFFLFFPLGLFHVSCILYCTYHHHHHHHHHHYEKMEIYPKILMYDMYNMYVCMYVCRERVLLLFFLFLLLGLTN